METIEHYRSISASAEDVASMLPPIPKDAPLQPEEMAFLTDEVSTYADLRFICDVLKFRRRQAYPPDWWEKVMNSGLYDQVQEKIGLQNKIGL